MKSIPWYKLAAGVFLLLPTSQLFSATDHTESLETAFVDGGQITVRLSAGEHQITESPDNHIRVHWQVSDRDRGGVEARTDVDGSTATIYVDGPRKDFSTLIQVPKNSDLMVRLSAGVLQVGNVGGDRDIKLRAGDLRIEVGNFQDYSNVKGSLWAGDIDAGPFDRDASGLFRSIEWQGEGEQDLHFRLYVGDVRLYQSEY